VEARRSDNHRRASLVEVSCHDLEREGLVSAIACKHVEDFTSLATVGALSAGHAEFPMCDYDFFDTPGYYLEAAVKKLFGHFLGRHCLQAWIESGDVERREGSPNCPNYCTRLYSQIDTLPVRLQPMVRDTVTYLRSDLALDQKVDVFLLNVREEDMVECFDASLGPMLAKLYQRSIRVAELEDEL
jgi:hypothetical protein